jgi:hypothetical protein
LNADKRKIPTFWPVVQEGQKPRAVPSIALLAASTYDPGLAETKRGSILKRVHPYTGFIAESQFTVVPASAVCQPSSDGCGPQDELPLRPRLRSRVIIIGQDSSSDVHQAPVGIMAGYLLQANYVEALLDDRVVFPTPRAVDIVVVVLCGFIIHSIFNATKRSPELGLLLSFGFLIVVAFAIYLATTISGYYTPAWPGSILAIVGRYLVARVELAKDKQRTGGNK